MDDRTTSFNPVEIQLGATAYYVSPGSSQEIPFALINRTGREDYFELSIRGIPPEWLQLDFPVLQVGADERREASFSIHAPEGAEGTFPAVLRASSQTNDEECADAVFDVRVVAHDTVQAGGEPTVEAAPGRIGLLLEPAQYHVVPGSSVVIRATLTNRGLFEDNFQLSTDGLPVGWVSTPTPNLRLMPGEQREITLYVQPPQTPSSRAGRYPFTLQVASQTEPGHMDSVDGILTVAAFSQFTSDLTPRHIDAGQTARLRIQNLGNFPSTYTVSWHNTNDDLEFVPSISGPVQVQPGDSTAIDFAISPRNPNFLGSSITLPYTVVVNSSEGDAQAHNGEVFSRALIPVWVMPAMLMACLTAICGMGFLWNWNQDRIAQATDTARQEVALIEQATTTAMFNQTAAALQGQEDTDGDGLADAQERTLGANPQSGDSDNDRLLDGDEVDAGFDPINPDTDGDGVLDGLDINPLDPNNPSLTATAEAGVPALVNTIPPTNPQPLPTPTLAAPQPTSSVQQPQPDTPSLAPLPTTPAEVIVTEQPPVDAPPLPTLTATQAAPTATATRPAPTATATRPAPTATATATSVPPTQQPTATSTQPAPEATETMAPPPTAEATPEAPPLPVTGLNVFVFESDRDGDVELYAVSPAQPGVIRLTNSPGVDTQPVISPDGSRILFTSERDGNNEIYVMNLDGSSPVNLTNHPADDSYPAWSPDGEHIFFTTNRDGNQEIYQMDANGENPVNLTVNPANDTTPVMYTRRGILIRTDRILFTSDRDGNNEIYALTLGSENAVNLTNNPANDELPNILPNGGKIIFVSDRDENTEIYIMDENGENQANLTNNPAADTQPTWATDGARILFTTDRDGNAEIYLMDSSGANATNLTQDPSHDQYADWQ